MTSGCLLSKIAIFVVVFQLLRKVVPWLYYNLIGPHFLGPKVAVRSMGSWAVVTGATDGIGKAYAKVIAKNGLNLVLISRSKDKLNTVATEISEKYKVEVRVVDVDFTGGYDIYDKIKSQIEGLDIGVLVNNVGISYPYPEFFIESYAKDPKFLRDIISANVDSVIHMTALILPAMVRRKKGVIINLSSTSAVIPNPLLSVYSATKAFVDKFSVDLQIEYRDQGITVQSVQPGFVATNMTKIRKPSLFAPSADAYVESAWKTLGIAGQTAGYLPHALVQLTIHVTGAIMGSQIASSMILKNLLNTRKRALRHLSKSN